jgi:hypothetical protein
MTTETDTSNEPIEPENEVPVVEQPPAILIDPTPAAPAPDSVKKRARAAFDAIEKITGPNAEARHWLSMPKTRDGVPTPVEQLEAMLKSLT